MLTRFTNNLINNKELLIAYFKENLPSSYDDVVKKAIEYCIDEVDYPDYDEPSSEKITSLKYNGVLVYIITSENESFIYNITSTYGSCSACDTFKGIYVMDVGSILDDDDIVLRLSQIESASIQYYNLALHCIQKMVLLHGY